MTACDGVDVTTEQRYPLWLCDEPECNLACEVNSPEAEGWLATEEAHFCPEHVALRFGSK